MAVDQIAKKEGVRIDKKLSRASVARCRFGGHSILLAKPLTYMNLSGEAVSGLAKFYKVGTAPTFHCTSPQRVDFEIALGSYKSRVFSLATITNDW